MMRLLLLLGLLRIINYKENTFEMNILKNDEIVNILVNNMISLLEELMHDYPKNIKFE